MEKKTKTVAVKKVATKKAVKKTAAKKVAANENSKTKKSLVVAADPQSFWVSDGQILNSLLALHDALHSMDKEVFGHHVSKGKNDFADWVEAVLCDEACAKDLSKVKTPASAKVVVAKHLKLYSI
jgi:hypothetical protein